MGNSRASKGMTLISSYKSAGAETSKTFTMTADDFSNTAKYVLVISGQMTAAFQLQIQVNGLTTNYYTDGYYIVGGAQTLINDDNQNWGEITDIANGSTNGHFEGQVDIYLSQGTGTQNLGMLTYMSVGGAIQQCRTTHNTDIESLTSIKILVSTSSWKADTVITLYRMIK